jgi:prolipoprotein diacylglyceryltransferase
MWPKLFEHDGVVLHTYGLFMLLSVCLAIASLFTLLAARRHHLAPAVDLTLLMILGYTLAARLLFALLGGDWEFFTQPALSKLRYGFWGAPLAFALLSGAYLLVSRVPMRVLADILAVTWAAVTVLHKVACFFAGC